MVIATGVATIGVADDDGDEVLVIRRFDTVLRRRRLNLVDSVLSVNVGVAVITGETVNCFLRFNTQRPRIF